MKSAILSFAILNILIFTICKSTNIQLNCEKLELIQCEEGYDCDPKRYFPNTLTDSDIKISLKFDDSFELDGVDLTEDTAKFSFNLDYTNYDYTFNLEDWKNLNAGKVSTILGNFKDSYIEDGRDIVFHIGAIFSTTCTRITKNLN
jgi:hypothetical protein